MDILSRYGHRSRMRQTYIKNGDASFNSCNILELYLSIIIPQRDVKPVAYALLNEFHSLENVFSADFNDLQKVCGIGENTAFLIRACNELMKRGADPDREDNMPLNNGRSRTAFAYSLMNEADKSYAVVFLNNKCECISYSYFDAYDSVANICSAVIKKALAIHSPMCYLVRRDSQCDADIFERDVKLLVDLKSFLLKFGVSICDYIIIGMNDAYVISESPNKKLLYC